MVEGSFFSFRDAKLPIHEQKSSIFSFAFQVSSYHQSSAALLSTALEYSTLKGKTVKRLPNDIFL